MSTIRTVIAAAAAVLVPAAAAFAELDVGDKAPTLKVEKWIQGKPVDLTEGKGSKIYVVEFWATWCPPCRASIPHLSKVAQRFEKKGVTVIGVSVDAKKEAVEPFVKGMGSRMTYTVALDGGDANKNWMEAAGAKGIPHAFIVD